MTASAASRRTSALACALASLAAAPALAEGVDVGGEVAAELRLFPSEGRFSGQFERWQPSLTFEPDIRWSSDGGAHGIVFVPFARLDGQDGERTHVDIREGYYRYVADQGWSLTLGLAKVFWGRAESRHLVDIVNQTDSVEDIDEEDKLGQPMIVENVGGVGGVLGVDRAAKAAPDGYTLVLNSGSTVAIAPFSMAKMPYDVKKDLAYITTVVLVPEVLAVNPSLPVNSLKELVDYAKANPGKINFGSAGGGTVTHLAGELLKVEAQVNLVHVPYKGAAPAVTDMLSGQVQMGVFDVPVLIAHIRAGKLKPLALTSAKRTPLLPNVPTTAEAGYGKVISDNWYGLVGPAGIPPRDLKRLHGAAIAALRVPALVEAYGKVAGIGFSVPGEGWKWKAANEAAPQIADAIAIMKNEKVAAFVKLPIEIK